MHRMLYSCTHMVAVGIKGLRTCVALCEIRKKQLVISVVYIIRTWTVTRR